MSFRNACLLVLFHRNDDYCSRSSVLAAIELIDFMGGATYLSGIRTSACNVRSNVSLHLLESFSTGNPGIFWLTSPKLHGLETSNFFQQQFKGHIWQWSPYLKNDFMHFAMDGHNFYISRSR